MLVIMSWPSVGYLAQKGLYSVERFVCSLGRPNEEVKVLGTCLRMEV